MDQIAHSLKTTQQTVARALAQTGEFCLAMHDRYVRQVPSSAIELRCVWAYHLPQTYEDRRSDPKGHEHVWTWVAVDSATKLIISYRVGDYSRQAAQAIIADLHSRIAGTAIVSWEQGTFTLTPDQPAQLPGLLDALPVGFHTDAFRRSIAPNKWVAQRLENHQHMVALFCFHFNFARSSGVPWTSAGQLCTLARRMLSFEDIVAGTELSLAFEGRSA